MNRRKMSLSVFVSLVVALGLATILARRAVKETSAIETYNVGVYWDFSCTTEVTSIDWSELTPGSTSSVIIFIRNEELTQQCFIYFLIQNWTPPQAANYLTLSWDYGGKAIDLGETVKVTLTLRIARNVLGVTDFSFTIVVFGTKYLIGDVNHDGAVDVFDAIVIAISYGSTPSDPNWNAEADLNCDNVIDILDAIILSVNYGKTP